MKVLGWLLVAVLVVAGLLSLDPAVTGLSETPPVLQAIALRGLLAVAGLLLGLVLVVAAGLRARGRQGAGRRLLVLGVVAALVGVGHGGVLLERGASASDDLGTKPEGAVDVLTLNTQGSAAGTDAVVALVTELGPDVVALQETTPEDAEEIAAAVEGYTPFTATTGPQPVQGTALLVAATMGEYEPAEAPAGTFGSVRAEPTDGDGPPLLSVHPVPPIGSDVTTWREELGDVVAQCDRLPGLILAGDLNATLDHAVLRDASCVDSSVGTGGLGTWPADRAPLLGAAIDHVLVDPAFWEPVASRVLVVPGGGDHRAVLVRLVPVD